ncbi:ABC-3 [Rhodobacterales bacterium HTCC2150]|nr:ABC-3 [Rhodobacterales bacterium HTCC2150] [Rhodobacteraceae bacterium HTCC2150]
MFDDFLVRAVFAGLGVAFAAAPLGCFVVWRRMAYFGDATAHAAILGVALSFAFGISIFAGVLGTSLSVAVLISFMGGQKLANDTLLGVMAHAGLAIGLVAASILGGAQVDLEAYLFGDILAVGQRDLALIWAGGALVVGLILWRWQPLLNTTLSPELAIASGIKPKREALILTMALAITVAVAIKVVGALLIGALLIIPAASARILAKSPESMAVMAALIGAASAIAGLWLSYQWDTPAGPSIVSAAAGFFIAVTVIYGVISKTR